MTNETYNILNLIVNIFIAFGTVSAVVVSLYFSKKDKEILKIFDIGGFRSSKLKINSRKQGKESDFTINITLSSNNYIDKAIVVNRIQIFFLNTLYLETREEQVIQNYGRNIKIFLREIYKTEDEMKKEIIKITNSKEIEIYLETNIGRFSYFFGLKKIKKLTEHLSKFPSIQHIEKN